MKQTLVITYLFWTFLSCNKTTENEKEANEMSEPANQISGKKFFDFDAIEHYQIDYEESKIGELIDSLPKSEIDSFKREIILGDIPNNISDLIFIEKLTKIGYKKTIIDTSRFSSINNIFVEKTSLGYKETACVYIYRDILIFKKEGEVIGTAKICFKCLANQIHGTNANTANFGQNGDYAQLEKILVQ